MYIFLPPLPLADYVAHTLTHYKRGREKGKRGEKSWYYYYCALHNKKIESQGKQKWGKGLFLY